MNNVLITGAQGVSGRNLAALLKTEKGIQVYRTDLRGDSGDDYSVCDLTDAEDVDRLIKKVSPDRIYHLAGVYSNDYPTNYQVNVLATKNIFDSCLKYELNVRVLLIGSAAEYGMVRPEENPVREDHPLSPVSLYGLSKAYQTELMKYYRNVYDLDVVMARTFNLLGEGFSPRLFIGNLLHQITDYKNGTIDKIVVGNLENKRDYLHVSKAVMYYRRIMDAGYSGEIYNVGSGASIKMSDLLNEIILDKGIDKSSIVCLNNQNTSKIDINDIYADVSKLKCLHEKKEVIRD